MVQSARAARRRHAIWAKSGRLGNRMRLRWAHQRNLYTQSMFITQIICRARLYGQASLTWISSTWSDATWATWSPDTWTSLRRTSSSADWAFQILERWIPWKGRSQGMWWGLRELTSWRWLRSGLQVLSFPFSDVWTRILLAVGLASNFWATTSSRPTPLKCPEPRPTLNSAAG